MFVPEDKRNPVERLAEEFLLRDRRGEHPSLSEYTGRYPELADEIRDLFPLLIEMEDARPSSNDEAEGPGPGLVPRPGIPRQFGDYRLLREIGRGGMGIVYEAEQLSLGRHVALKILPAHIGLEPQRLMRFRREAKAAARLHHTNIVPVFGIGEEDGLHYYVMQFIQGQGLEEVLRELRKLRVGTGPAPDDRHRPAAAGFGGCSAAEVAHALLTGQFSPGEAGTRLGKEPILDDLEVLPHAAGDAGS